jgi:hypothetical protein
VHLRARVVYDQMDFLKQLGVIEHKGFPDEDI